MLCTSKIVQQPKLLMVKHHMKFFMGPNQIYMVFQNLAVKYGFMTQVEVSLVDEWWLDDGLVLMKTVVVIEFIFLTNGLSLLNAQ